MASWGVISRWLRGIYSVRDLWTILRVIGSRIETRLIWHLIWRIIRICEHMHEVWIVATKCHIIWQLQIEYTTNPDINRSIDSMTFFGLQLREMLPGSWSLSVFAGMRKPDICVTHACKDGVKPKRRLICSCYRTVVVTVSIANLLCEANVKTNKIKT